MAEYSKFAIAFDDKDFARIKPHLDAIEANPHARRSGTDKILTKEHSYTVVYWNFVVAYTKAFVDLKYFLDQEPVRHAWIEITEDGEILNSVETEDADGEDGFFEEILSWRVEIETPNGTLE